MCDDKTQILDCVSRRLRPRVLGLLINEYLKRTVLICCINCLYSQNITILHGSQLRRLQTASFVQCLPKFVTERLQNLWWWLILRDLAVTVAAA